MQRTLGFFAARGGDLDSTGMRKLKTAYRGLRVHVKEAVNNQVPTTTTHWLPN